MCSLCNTNIAIKRAIVNLKNKYNSIIYKKKRWKITPEQSKAYRQTKKYKRYMKEYYQRPEYKERNRKRSREYYWKKKVI